MIEGDAGDLVVRVRIPASSSSGWGSTRQDRTDRPASRRAGPRRRSRSNRSRPIVDVRRHRRQNRWRSTASAATSPWPARRARPRSKASAATCASRSTAATCSVESVSGDIDLRGKLNGEMYGRDRVRRHQLRQQRPAPAPHRHRHRVGRRQRSRRPCRTAVTSSAESVSGDIHLVCRDRRRRGSRGETFSGDLNAPGAPDRASPKYGPGASFEHRYGSGNGEIRIETFSGDAELILD